MDGAGDILSENAVGDDIEQKVGFGGEKVDGEGVLARRSWGSKVGGGCGVATIIGARDGTGVGPSCVA